MKKSQMKITRHQRLNPKRNTNSFMLDVQKLDQIVNIGKDLPMYLRMRIAEILVEYKDICMIFLGSRGCTSTHCIT